MLKYYSNGKNINDTSTMDTKINNLFTSEYVPYRNVS